MLKIVRDGLRIVNPLAKHSTLAEARMAARLGSLALVGTALQSLVSSLIQRSDQDEIKNLLIRAKGSVSFEQAAANEVLYAQLAPMIVALLWGVMLVTVAVCAVLAWVQWHKLTKIIPLLYLGVSALGLAMALRTLMDPDVRVLAMDAASSSQTLMAVVLAVLMVSAYRGASQYHVLKGARS